MSTAQSRKTPRATAAKCASLVFAIALAAAMPSNAAAGPNDPFFRSSYLELNESVNAEGPHPVAVGDVNNDHAPDLVVVRSGLYGPFGNVGIYLGDGYGNFAKPMNLDGALSQDIWGVDLADLNRDGNLDLVFSSRRDTLVYVRLGHGDGTFDPPITSADHYTANSVSLGDMNEDGIPDLVIGQGPFGSGFSILLGDGTGHFTRSYRGVTYNTAQSVLTDMDGDGHLDIVGSDHVYTAGDGHGATTGERWAGATTWGSAVAVADLDGDGNKDILTAGSDDGRLSVRYGQPGGLFPFNDPRDTTYAFPDGIRSVIARDLDGDGRPEVITGGADVRVYSTDFAGRLQLRQELPSPTGRNPLAVEAADLNGDGRPDIIAATSGGIGIYLTGPGGTFPVAPSLALAGRPGPAVSGNFSGDGQVDVAVLLPDNDAVEVVHGAPDGTLTLESRAGVGHGPRAIVCADVDGDGRDDLVIADSLDAMITVLTHRADHTWQRTDIPGVAGMHWLAVGDVDQDGRPDIVTEDTIAGNLYVMRGMASGFGAPVIGASAPGNCETVVLEDFDGDGDPDLLLADHDGQAVFLAGTPGIGFVWKVSFGGAGQGYSVTGVSAFAFDHDRWPDAIVSGPEGYSIIHGTGLWSYNGGGWWRIGNLDSFSQGTGHIALADLDGDGWTDFATTLRERPYVATLRRNPDDVFDQNVWGYGFGATIPDQCLLADITGDGLPDLVVTDPDARRLWVAPHVPTSSTGVATLPGRAGAMRLAFAGSAPNPTRGPATLRFERLAPGRVHLEIADVRGRIVRRLLDRDVTAGSLSAAWDGRDDAGIRVGPGIYFARLVTQQGAASGKLVVL